MNAILAEYEDVLVEIEAINTLYENKMPLFFDALQTIKTIVKKSNDNKASKKVKDTYFDEAADVLKDTLQQLITVYANGNAIN